MTLYKFSRSHCLCIDFLVLCCFGDGDGLHCVWWCHTDNYCKFFVSIMLSLYCYLCQGDRVFASCCWLVCLSIGLFKKLLMNFYEIFWTRNTQLDFWGILNQKSFPCNIVKCGIIALCACWFCVWSRDGITHLY